MRNGAPRYKQNRLQQLRGFCYAAADGSVTKAAKRMYLSQPSVSQQIRALEEEFATKLFHRRRSGIHLTKEGELLFEMANPLLDEIETLPQRFAEHCGRSRQGRVEVAAGNATILNFLPCAVREYRSRHPAVEINLRNVSGREGKRLLENGEVDLAVGPMARIPEPLSFHPIATFDPVIITELGHPLAGREDVTLPELSLYPFILPPRDLSTWKMVDKAFRKEGLEWRAPLEVGGWDVIKRYVALGVGISLVMSVCLDKDDELAVIPAKRFFPSRTYGVLLNRKKVLTPQAHSFIRLLVPEFEAE